LPNLASVGTKIRLYAEETSTVVTSPNTQNYETKIRKIFGDINSCFNVNQLILNYNKKHYLQFIMKRSLDYDLKLIYHGTCVKSSSNKKFLLLIIEDSL
jgi:hypothetical protein